MRRRHDGNRGGGPRRRRSPLELEVEDDGAARLRAADQHVAVGGLVDRLRGRSRPSPDIRPVSQVWQTPVRHDQRTGTSHASASSSRLAVAGGATGRSGRCARTRPRARRRARPAADAAAAAGAARCPGVGAGAAPKISVWIRAAGMPELDQRGGDVGHERRPDRTGTPRRRAAGSSVGAARPPDSRPALS